MRVGAEPSRQEEKKETAAGTDGSADERARELESTREREKERKREREKERRKMKDER